MKVLFLTNIPSPYRVDFFNELGKKCELTVLFEKKSAKDRDENWIGEKIKNFKAVFLKGISVGVAEGFSLQVIKYLSDKSFDKIIVGMYSTPTAMLAIEYMNFKRIPFILSTDGGIPKMDSGIKLKIKKHFISSANSWLSTGNATTEYLKYYGANSNKIFEYPFTSVRNKDILTKPLTKDEKIKLREKLCIKEKKVVISVGQFIYRKGYDILLRACKGLDENIGIYIIGGNPTEEYLKLKEKLDLKQVYFLNFKSKSELYEYYKAADIFVLPTREDIWGLVINEAMSAGLPVITTDRCVAGIEMIDNRNGIIIPAENVEKQKQAILDLLENDELIREMSIGALEKAKEYSIENMANETLYILQERCE